jgi:hypothetical protein
MSRPPALRSGLAARAAGALAVLAAAMAAATAAPKAAGPGAGRVAAGEAGAGRAAAAPEAPRQAGLEAFSGIAAVLRHPRCLNCHTATNFPRQGDDRHPHANLVRRGPDNRGAPGLPCSTCHQAENDPASGVPGRPNWRLAPLSMAWEGLSDAALCRTLQDPRHNGGRDLHAISEHLAHDPLVGHGWDPGAGRKPVPLPREELARLMAAWVQAGAPCPQGSAAR